nr:MULTISPECIES: hypothetical protein [unclassified Ornithinimicrobium]
MAAGDLQHLSGGQVEVRSAGSAPAGQGTDAVRPIRDEIKARVVELIGSWGVAVCD